MTYPPLEISERACRQHDRELLRIIADYPTPVSLLHVFDGSSPRWATDAARRLTAIGDLEEVGDNGELAVTDAGRRGIGRVVHDRVTLADVA